MFKLVKEYYPFEVSEEGVLRNHLTGKIVPHHINSWGYAVAAIYYEGRCVWARVHRLVAIAYIPNPKNKPIVHHKNHDRSDFSKGNLEWVTASENIQEGVDCGSIVAKRGEYSNLSSVSDEEIHEVCRLLQDGLRPVDIHRITGVTAKIVGDVRRRASWNHISSQYKNFENILPKSKKMSVNKVHQICRLLEAGEKMVDISNKLNIPYSLIKPIKYRRTYKSISDGYKW